MADIETVAVLKVPELGSLEIGRDAICFAALAQRSAGTTKYGTPYWKCIFKDKHAAREFAIWADDPLLDQVPSWTDGEAYRLKVRAKSSQRGIDLKLIEIRPVRNEDIAEGFEVANLYEVSRFELDECYHAIRSMAQENIQAPHIKALVLRIWDRFEAELKRMPAAQTMHHAFTGGLIEHIRSMTRICIYLARHYGRYYHDLDPPLNQDIIVATAILHDIGKLFELAYHPISARYTIKGCLIGHIVMGRDLIRETAAEIPDFDEESLLLLEHALLAHHGKREFGSPVLPQTLEALIVSFADELDAKINQAARGRLHSQTDDPFTDDVFGGPDRRRIYKGIRKKGTDAPGTGAPGPSPES